MNHSSSENDPFIKSQVLIAAGLIIACIVYLTVVIYLVLSSAKEGNPATTGWSFDNPMSIIASAMILLAIPPALLFPQIIRSNSIRMYREHSADEKLSSEASARAITQTSNIVRLALIEGAVFFSIFAFFFTRSLIPLAASAFGILVMMFFFPWPEKTREHLSDVFQELNR